MDEPRGVLVDGTSAYQVVSHLLGTSRWLQAERIEQRHLTPGRGLASFVRELAEITPDGLLDAERWPSLAGVGMVEPDQDLLAIRGRLGAAEDHTLTTTVARGSIPVPCALPRVVASKLRTGRMPKLLEVYTFEPSGIVADARRVRLPGGIVFDPRLDRARRGKRFRDLPSALAEVGLLAKAGVLPGSDAHRMRRILGSVKVARNGAAYGGPVEFNASAAGHPTWGPGGKLSRPIHEEPGWLTDPVVGSLVVAGCELLITTFEELIRREIGS